MQAQAVRLSDSNKCHIQTLFFYIVELYHTLKIFIRLKIVKKIDNEGVFCDIVKMILGKTSTLSNT